LFEEREVNLSGFKSPRLNAISKNKLNPCVNAQYLPIRLSHREKEVVDLMLLGMTNKEIARHLYLSPETVKTHASNLFRKLGARNRTEAAIKVLALVAHEAPYSSRQDFASLEMVAEADQEYTADDSGLRETAISVSS
jgi:DNA-binding CsgD family transcriptional regulator